MFSLPDDPYARLGVSKDAQIPEIRSAHRKLVLKCHPDKVADPEQKAIKQEEFQKVQQAYERLSDSNERQKYDDMVRANELEKANIRIRPTESATYSSRTPPRREGTTEAHHYNVRVAEPRFERSASGYASAPKGNPVYSSSRAQPRSYEENIYSSGYDDGREHRSSRKAGPTAYEREAPSSRRAEEDKKSRKEADKAWEKQREKAEKESRRRAEEKERDRREKEKEKERREKKDKADRKERKRETDEKRSRHRSPSREEESASPIIVDALHKFEKSSKAKANTRAKVIDPTPVRDATNEDKHRTKQDAHLEFAAQYLQTSRSKGPPGLTRAQTYHPSMGYAPPVPTPPPAVGAMAPPPPPIPEDDEPVKRSSARRASHDTPRSKLSSSHKKSSRLEEESPRIIPKMKTYSSMPTQRHSPPAVPESPPRMSRAQTDSYSRPPPGSHPTLARAQTWYPATAAAEEYRGSRSKHHARYHSDDDYDDYSEDERYSRRPTRHHSPEASKTKFRYMVENSKAIPVRSRAESPGRRGYKTSYYNPEASSGRPMATYDNYEQQGAYFPKVKYAPKYEAEDVAYSTTTEANYRMAEPTSVYGY